MTQDTRVSNRAVAGQETVDRALEGRAAAKMPLADPGAWAVLAFASTAFMLRLFNAGLVDPLGATLVDPDGPRLRRVGPVRRRDPRSLRQQRLQCHRVQLLQAVLDHLRLIENGYAGEVAAAAGKAERPARSPPG